MHAIDKASKNPLAGLNDDMLRRLEEFRLCFLNREILPNDGFWE
jgi:hypothetical protein